MKKLIAKTLLEKEAVTLNIEEPYTYVSGIRSPIYCDNRVLTFYPEERKAIIQGFVSIIGEMDPDIIAGTASSAISWAAWVAQELDKPLVYIRKKSKDYGHEKLIEGGDISGRKVVVVEDLVSTGGSSWNAVQACRDAGAEVIGMVAIFTYGFSKAGKLFQDGGCETRFLTDFDTLIKVAAENHYLEEDKLGLVLEWNKAPAEWGPRHGFPLGEKRN